MQKQPELVTPIPRHSLKGLKPNGKSVPPKPTVRLEKQWNKGVFLSWCVPPLNEDSYECIKSFKIYSYQETSEPQTWQLVGVVTAATLPMATALELVSGAGLAHKYYFSLRAVDVRGRMGPISDPVCVNFAKFETENMLNDKRLKQ